MFKKRFLLNTVYCILSTVLIGCTTIYNPATGKKEIVFIDTEQEVAIGKNVEQEVLKKYPFSQNQALQQYVRRVGGQIASVSDRQDLAYSFTVLEHKELNAFTLPGGGIYINDTLVEKLTQEELAAVLAHEVGHVAARHAVKRIQSQLGYQLLISVALAGVGEDNAQTAKTVARGTNSIFSLILLGYSRQDELLADKLAIKYADRAGYNPWGMVTALRKLEQHSKEKVIRPLAVLRSHPYLQDRIRAAEAEVALLE